MRILYVITQADGGGAQKYTLTLAKHFGGIIAAGAEAKKLFADAAALGIECVELPHLRRNINPWHDFMAIWEIRQLIKNLQPGIVHLNSSKAGVLGSFAGIGLKTKVIFTAHGFIFNEPLNRPAKAFYLAAEKIASDFRDYIICVSEADRRSALDVKLIPDHKISTIYNGLGQIEFLPKDVAQKQLGLPGDKILLGSVANFYKTKGLDILIDAIAMLDENTRQKIQVAIIGSGPEIENLKLKIENLGLQNNITLLGKIDDADKYLKAFDVFVLPSRKEGLPYALLEAMQAGLPIVAASVGGIPEALSNGGLLVPPENSKALSQAIQNLINDPKLAGDLGSRARLLSGEFTEQKMFEETKKVYEKLLEKDIN